MYLFLQFGPKTAKMSAINQIIILTKSVGGVSWRQVAGPGLGVVCSLQLDNQYVALLGFLNFDIDTVNKHAMLRD